MIATKQRPATFIIAHQTGLQYHTGESPACI